MTQATEPTSTPQQSRATHASLPESVTQNSSASSTPPTATSTPPTITVNGENPAIIHIGDTYADLGATITGADADKNLGIKTFLNGALVSNIVLDTTAVATDTIDYVATDTWGNTATSTRMVVIESIAPAAVPDTASSTQATSTAL